MARQQFATPEQAVGVTHITPFERHDLAPGLSFGESGFCFSFLKTNSYIEYGKTRQLNFNSIFLQVH
jgi:hypothetical protein